MKAVERGSRLAEERSEENWVALITRDMKNAFNTRYNFHTTREEGQYMTNTTAVTWNESEKRTHSWN